MAAGLGFKTFATGDVLTAGDTNGYLMQGVWVFADAAARSAAVTSPQEGNISYLKDTNSTEYYSGSAWVAIGGGSSSITNARSYVATDEGTTSTSYTDLATSQSVTLTTGTKVLVGISAALYNNTANQSALASVAVSGATTTAASSDWCIKLRNATAVSQDWRFGVSTILTCTAGSNTFTMKFSATGGGSTANFYNRELIVVNLG